ncbi:MAG: hypothetical protein PHO08_16110 [Methylococcales bacterium]|nr:hypothetical protein [Methylococcales bacterium]MDD5630423.1 hypothetical protein [Methylococcales bacterium]
MGHYLNVQALDKKGNPLKGTKVKIDIAGIFKGGTLENYTDSNGHAEFETAANYESSRKLNIYLHGQSFGPYEIGGGSYTVTLK